jgi:uncharacterized protein (TIGR00251 family)
MIALTDHAEGCLLPVRAQPGARRSGIQGERNGALKLSVTAPPEDGRANAALIEMLRKCLGLKRSQIEIIGGATGRDKRFLIRGMNKEILSQKISQLLGDK